MVAARQNVSDMTVYIAKLQRQFLSACISYYVTYLIYANLLRKNILIMVILDIIEQSACNYYKLICLIYCSYICICIVGVLIVSDQL